MDKKHITKTSTRSQKTVRLCGIRFAQFYRKAPQFFAPVMLGVIPVRSA